MSFLTAETICSSSEGIVSFVAGMFPVSVEVELSVEVCAIKEGDSKDKTKRTKIIFFTNCTFID